MRINGIAALLVVSAGFPSLAFAANWPQPGMNAAHTAYNAAEKTLSASNAGALATSWSFTTSGEIAAAPVQLGSLVYALSTNGTLYALEAKTGVQKWSYVVNKNGAPTSWGVAANGTKVFVNCQLDYDSGPTLGHGGLCALNATTGALVWSYAIYNDPTGNPVNSAPYNPPVLDGGKVFMGESDSASYAHVGYVVALDQATGAGVWVTGNCGDTQLNDCNIVGPAPFAASNGYLYYTSGATSPPAGSVATLCKISEATGAISWCHYITDSAAAPSIASGKVVFFENGLSSTTNTIIGLDAATGATSWSYPLGTQSSSPDAAPAIANGTAFVEAGTNGFGNLYALGLTAGKLKWSYASNGAAGGVSSGPSVANGVVFAQCRNATGQCAFAASNGAVLQSIGPASGTPSAPLVANGAEITVCGENSVCRYVPGLVTSKK